MKIFLIILLSVAGLIVLLLSALCLLLGLRLLYDGENGLRVKVGALCFFKTVYPRPRKLLRPDKEAKKQAKKLKKHQKKAGKGKKTVKQPEKPKKKGDFGEMLGFYRDLTEQVLLPAAEKLGRRLHVKVKRMKIEIASEDAGRTAVLYALAVSGATALFELLRNTVVFKTGKDRDLSIVSRFDRTEGSAEGELIVALRPLPTALSLLPQVIGFLKMKQEYEEKEKR